MKQEVTFGPVAFALAGSALIALWSIAYRLRQIAEQLHLIYVAVSK